MNGSSVCTAGVSPAEWCVWSLPVSPTGLFVPPPDPDTSAVTPTFYIVTPGFVHPLTSPSGPWPDHLAELTFPAVCVQTARPSSSWLDIFIAAKLTKKTGVNTDNWGFIPFLSRRVRMLLLCMLAYWKSSAVLNTFITPRENIFPILYPDTLLFRNKLSTVVVTILTPAVWSCKWKMNVQWNSCETHISVYHYIAYYNSLVYKWAWMRAPLFSFIHICFQ